MFLLARPGIVAQHGAHARDYLRAHILCLTRIVFGESHVGSRVSREIGKVRPSTSLYRVRQLPSEFHDRKIAERPNRLSPTDEMRFSLNTSRNSDLHVAVSRLLIAVCLFLITPERNGEAQTSTQQRDTRKNTTSSRDPKHNVELKSILDLAAGVPPEFGADSLLRLVESAKVTDPALKVKLLEKAFYLAESAQQPIKLVGMPGSLVDTRSGYLAMAFRSNLDRLSLQSRAVVALLPLDRVKAGKLFEQIRLPALKPLGCEELLIYDPSSYYQTLATVLNDGSAAKEDREKRVVALVQPVVTEISSHTQVPPVMKMLTSLNLPAAQLADMTSFFAGSLEKLQGDERSFSVVATKYIGLGALAQLISKLDGEGLLSANLLQVSRQYVVRNLRDTRCNDNGQRQRTSLPRAAEDFNELFGTALVSARLHPIHSDELENYKLGSPPQFHPYWQSSSAKELLAGIKKLRFGTGETPIPVTERKTTGWNTEFGDFLAKLESWEPTDSEETQDFFHEKCVLYVGLLDLIPPGPEQSKVIRSYVTFLELNSFEGTNRIEWFWHVADLLERLSAERENKGRTQVLEAFRNSRDPTLNLYARVETWLFQAAAPPGSGVSGGHLGAGSTTGARCSSLDSEQRELSNVWNPCDDLTQRKSSKIVN